MKFDIADALEYLSDQTGDDPAEIRDVLLDLGAGEDTAPGHAIAHVIEVFLFREAMGER